ncbi:hypothetical protein BH11BAC6_BH11BAC6_03410 [soil metagenome]
MDEFEGMNEEEKLKAENEFLKIKMMLERGTEFQQGNEEDALSADIENKFLKNIMEFEKQFDKRTIVTIFDKLGNPSHFKPVSEIPDDEIEEAWTDLSNYMIEHGIELTTTNPKITAKELYRFTIEELFEHETDDIDIPDMISGFVYDEFHPDYEYENTKYALDDCINLIFDKAPVDYMPHLGKKVTLNKHEALSQDAYKALINQFKDAFDDIILNDATVTSCTIEETACTIKGAYNATAFIGNEKLELKNKWTVIFYFDDENGYWDITSVQIEGVAF